MKHMVNFQLFTNGCIEVEAENIGAAQQLVEDMSDEYLLGICNELMIEFTDEDGFYLD